MPLQQLSVIGTATSAHCSMQKNLFAATCSTCYTHLMFDWWKMYLRRFDELQIGVVNLEGLSQWPIRARKQIFLDHVFVYTLPKHAQQYPHR
nr:protein FAR1-RELATED SEQUENCE 7-like [Ipomoea batatas]